MGEAVVARGGAGARETGNMVADRLGLFVGAPGIEMGWNDRPTALK